MLPDFPSEFREKLQAFASEGNLSPSVDRQMPFNVLSDDLFVRMMMDFAVETHFDINRMSEVRNALLACIDDFSPDGIVMHRHMATFLVKGVDEALVSDDGNDSNMECTLYGIRTVLCQDDGFPCNKVLMIRNGEPNPTSLLLSFKAV